MCSIVRQVLTTIHRFSLESLPPSDDDMLDKYWSEHGQQASSNGGSNDSSPANYIQVATRDADLHYLISKVHMAEEDSEEQKEAREQVDTLLRARRYAWVSAMRSILVSSSYLFTVVDIR